MKPRKCFDFLIIFWFLIVRIFKACNYSVAAYALRPLSDKSILLPYYTH